MISKLRLLNFKSFKNTGELELSPLTVLSGKNSSGKSSILQSILLLKQSLTDDLPEHAIVLDGKYLQYSSLREISFGVPRERDATIGYEFTFKLPDNHFGKIQLEIKQFYGKKYLTGAYPIVKTFKWNDGTDEDWLTIKAKGNKYIWPKNIRVINPFSILKGLINKKIDQPSKEVLAKVKDVKFTHFLPTNLEVSFPEKSGIKITTTPIALAIAAQNLHAMIENLKDTLLKTKYLGPSRAIPRRAYVHYSEKHYDLDDDGGNAAYLLWIKRKEIIKWKGNHVPLEEAVSDCLSIMGLDQFIKASKSSNIVYQLLLSIRGDQSKYVTLADVGFGYSQILPIILRGLLSDNSGLLLFEQPEIHLHPSAQARLADLFIAFISEGRRIIVETHSTEFINCLQLRSLQNIQLCELVNLIFVEPSSQDGEGSSIRQIKLKHNGMFTEWPDGFCDETDKLARLILKEAIASSSSSEIAKITLD